MSSQPDGLYNKYTVTRTDGRDAAGGDRADSEYFVLDLTHDKHAMPALAAYVDSLVADGRYPELADDLIKTYFQE